MKTYGNNDQSAQKGASIKLMNGRLKNEEGPSALPCSASEDTPPLEGARFYGIT